MYAIFEDGSRQYRVQEGDTVRVDYRSLENGDSLPNGAYIEFNRVLILGGQDDIKIGQPTLDGVRVLVEVLKETSTKVYVQHFRRRKNYRRLKGHRQPYLLVKVKNILLPGQPTPKPELRAAEAPAETPAAN